LFVALLGPDGAGKSTLLARLVDDLAPAFRRTALFHLRPRLGAAGSTESRPDPHAAPPRGVGGSVVKLTYWLADYAVGYALRIWPRLVRSTLVLFDRYYFDLLVDTRRYRYGGPRWLIRLFGVCIPAPDLTIILDVPAEALRARKAELTLDEARRQRDEYLRLSRSLESTHVVDAARDIETVTAAAETMILDYLAGRAAERLGC
jgi:thymidylate kinase